MWKEKEKKEDEETKLTEPSEEKKEGQSCNWLWPWDPVCSFNYENAIENRVMETENI